MLGLGCGPAALPVSQRGTNPAPAPSRPDFAALGLTPAFAYHPHTATVTLDGSNQLTGVTGQNGSPNLTPSSPGPLQITDAAGKKAWRFRGSDYLDLPNSFVSTPRAMTVFMVQRSHLNGSGGTVNYFGHKFQSDGVTNANTNGAQLRGFAATNDLQRLRCQSIAPAVSEKVITGCCNMQLVGTVGRATASGGTRFIVNGWSENGAQPFSSLIGLQGARIGGYLQSNGTSNQFDLYYAVGFAGELTDGQADAVRDYLLGFFGIPAAYTQNYVLDGDSITAGVGNVSGENPAMYLCEPGRTLLPSTVRVMNMASSGAQLAGQLVPRRDGAAGWPSAKIGANAADNLFVGHIGRNDLTTGGKTAATLYPDIVAFINAASVGVTARGWNVRWVANIAAGAAGIQAEMVALRARLRADLATDTAALGVVGLDLIEDAGATRFEDSADTGNLAYYQADVTHPTAYGALTMASGGTTPANGLQAGL